jgi:hypothetical protein
MRRLVGVLAAVLVLGVVPAHAEAPAEDPRATAVTGACFGGPGRLSLTVHPPAAAGGRYQVDVTARRLVDGSRWVIGLAQEANDEGGAEKDFRRVAEGGGWTVAAEFPSPAASGEVVFYVSAYEHGARRHGCYVLNSPASPVGGLSLCNNPRRGVVMLARERDDGSTLIRSILFNVGPDSRWHLELTATGAASRQVVEFDDRAGKRGYVWSRVVIEGVKDPRLRLVATNQKGGRCFLRLNPANVTTDAPLKLRGIAKSAP